jgi:hypothetical protein
MNTETASIRDIAHHMNLALLPRHHAFRTTQLTVRRSTITIERHPGQPYAASAASGDAYLFCDGCVWTVTLSGQQLIQTANPMHALQHFWQAMKRGATPSAFLQSA